MSIQNSFIPPPVSSLPTLISVSGATGDTIAGTFDRYISFPDSGSGATKTYTFTTTEALTCDILVIGGGGSGGGKSTIASLVLRFYNADNGNILIDGKPIQDYDLSALRKQIAYVPQDVILFGGTIYENILYGKPDASKEEVLEAAKKANA